MHTREARHRNGLAGHVGPADSNGFRMFYATTGATFTVAEHELEMPATDTQLATKARRQPRHGCYTVRAVYRLGNVVQEIREDAPIAYGAPKVGG